MKLISLNNGESYKMYTDLTLADIEFITDPAVWDNIDFEPLTRHAISHIYAPCSKLKFLREYLDAAFDDLTIGDEMAKISLDNGISFKAYEDLTLADVEYITTPGIWDGIAWDFATKTEADYLLAPCSRLQFLKGYLKLTDRDLIIG